MKLPPYGKGVPDACRELWIYSGDEAWQLSKLCAKNPGRVILPPVSDPLLYRWPVRGREALVVQDGQESELRLLRLAHALLRDGATVVRVIHGATYALAVFRHNDKDARCHAA